MVNQTGAVFAQAEKMEFKYPPLIPPLAEATSSTREPDGEDPPTTEKTKHFEGNPELDATRTANLFIKNGLILPLGIRRARW